MRSLFFDTEKSVHIRSYQFKWEKLIIWRSEERMSEVSGRHLRVAHVLSLRVRVGWVTLVDLRVGSAVSLVAVCVTTSAPAFWGCRKVRCPPPAPSGRKTLFVDERKLFGAENAFVGIWGYPNTISSIYSATLYPNVCIKLEKEIWAGTKNGNEHWRAGKLTVG